MKNLKQLSFLTLIMLIAIILFSCKNDAKETVEPKDEITMIAESPEFLNYFEVVNMRTAGRTPENTQYVNDFLLNNNLMREMILDPCSIVENELVKTDPVVVAFLKSECAYNRAHSALMDKYDLSTDSLRVVTQAYIDIQRAKALEEQE